MTPKLIPKVLIPAAGFGKRMGQPESKEMLLHPLKRPLIEEPIRLTLERGWTPLVITRPEKKTLIHFVQNIEGCECLEVSDTKEWPETLLKSEVLWNDINIVMLPDTEFQPLSIIDEMAKALQTHPTAFATFKALDPQNWGIIKTDRDQVFVCEKPQETGSDFEAWGLFGFNKQSGRELLQNMLESTFDHRFKAILRPTKLLKLTQFSDLTRG